MYNAHIRWDGKAGLTMVQTLLLFKFAQYRPPLFLS